jgi:hypothetical protein
MIPRAGALRRGGEAELSSGRTVRGAEPTAGAGGRRPGARDGPQGIGVECLGGLTSCLQWVARRAGLPQEGTEAGGAAPASIQRIRIVVTDYARVTLPALRHLAQTRSVQWRPFTSAWTVCRLGRCWRRVRLSTCAPAPPCFLGRPRRATALPLSGPLPQISQQRDTVVLLFSENEQWPKQTPRTRLELAACEGTALSPAVAPGRHAPPAGSDVSRRGLLSRAIVSTRQSGIGPHSVDEVWGW